MGHFFFRNLMRHDDLLIDTRRAVVRRGVKQIELPDLSFRVLLRLIQEAPEPVSRDQLARDVWEQAYVAEDVIAQRIALLRKALGDETAKPRYVRTIRGKGYSWIALPARVGFWIPVTAAILFSGLLGAGLLAISGNEAFQILSRPAETGEPVELAPLLARGREQLAVQQADETDRAIEIFEEAVRTAPESIDAITGLSFALSTRITKFTPADLDMQRAEDLARQAIALNERSAAAWHALGYSLDSQGRVGEAIAAYERAFTLDPGEMAARSSAAYLNIISGRFYSGLAQELTSINEGFSSRYAEIQIALALDLMGFEAADEWMTRAVRANPDQPVVIGALARRAMRHGDFDTALAILENVGDDAQTDRLAVLRGRALLRLGQNEDAREAFEEAGERGRLLLAAIEAIEGDYNAARQIVYELRQPEADSDTWPEAALRSAELMAALGEDDRALDYLARAIDLGWRDWSEISESVFVGRLADLPIAQHLRQRIDREIEAQRQLVMADDALTAIIFP